LADIDAKALLAEYDPDKIVIAAAASHSSLQIFHGARQEGFRTLGICVGPPPRHYDAFPRARPDEFLSLKSYKDLVEKGPELVKKNVVIVPHGSLVEYLGVADFERIPCLTFGNRKVLRWESDRGIERTWLESAGLPIPVHIDDPEEIRQPVIVKYHGAKGGKGFFIARNRAEFDQQVDRSRPYTIQEFVLGTRYYLHYFYSPITDDGYRLSKGSLQLLSIDRRDESNIDEANRLGSVAELARIGIQPTFVVTGNIPMVIRESLLPQVFDMGQRVVERSLELFGGMIGPFCLETVVTDQLQFRVFEISARIVAGTNPYISGSPYADFIEPGLSTGRRIAREIASARKQGRLLDVLT
jgi:5-formaminoimidazole-4-carboxamide-1-(beta)-D-ribofuranosyl 5'-monophosphate synthetase